MSKSMSQIDDDQPKDRGVRPEALPDDVNNQHGSENDPFLRPEAQLPKSNDVVGQGFTRRGKRQPRPIGTTWHVFTTVISAAFIVATLFSIWSPGSLIVKSLPDQMVDALSVAPLGAITPTPA